MDFFHWWQEAPLEIWSNLDPDWSSRFPRRALLNKKIPTQLGGPRCECFSEAYRSLYCYNTIVFQFPLLESLKHFCFQDNIRFLSILNRNNRRLDISNVFNTKLVVIKDFTWIIPGEKTNKENNSIQFIIHRSHLGEDKNKGRTKMLSGCKN